MASLVSELRLTLRAINMASGEINRVNGDLAALGATVTATNTSQANIAALAERAAAAQANALDIATANQAKMQSAIDDAAASYTAYQAKAVEANAAISDSVFIASDKMQRAREDATAAIVAADTRQIEAQNILSAGIQRAELAQQRLTLAQQQFLANPTEQTLIRVNAAQIASDAATQRVEVSTRRAAAAQLEYDTVVQRTTEDLAAMQVKQQANIDATVLQADKAQAAADKNLVSGQAGITTLGGKLDAQTAKAIADAEAATLKYNEALAAQPGLWDKITASGSAALNVIERFARIGVTVLTAVTAITTAVGVAFDATRQKQELEFQGLLDDSSLAIPLLNQVYDFTRQTSLSFSEAGNAAQQLIERGFGIGNIVPVLKAVTDQAAALPGALNENVTKIIQSISQIGETGVLNSRELQQLTTEGVNAWRLLADASGESVTQIKKDVAAGAIDSQTAIDLLVAGMERDFAGMAQTQRQTFGGMVAVAKRDFSELAGTFAQPIFNGLLNDLDKLTNYLERADVRSTLASWGTSFNAFIDIVGRGLGTIVIPALEWIINNKAVLAAVGVAMAFGFAAFLPGGEIALGIGAIAAVIGLIKSNNADLPEWLLEIKVKILEWKDAANDVLKAIDHLFESIVNAVSQPFKIAFEIVFPQAQLEKDYAGIKKFLQDKLGVDVDQLVNTATGGLLGQGNFGGGFNGLIDLLHGNGPGGTPSAATTAAQAQLAFDKQQDILSKGPFGPSQADVQAANDFNNKLKIAAQTTNNYADASQDAAKALKDLETEISAAFKYPTVEQAGLQLQLDILNKRVQDSAAAFALQKQQASESANAQLEYAKKNGGAYQYYAEQAVKAAQNLTDPTVRQRDAIELQLKDLEAIHKIEQDRITLANPALLTEKQLAETVVPTLITNMGKLSKDTIMDEIIPSLKTFKLNLDNAFGQKQPSGNPSVPTNTFGTASGSP